MPNDSDMHPPWFAALCSDPNTPVRPLGLPDIVWGSIPDCDLLESVAARRFNGLSWCDLVRSASPACLRASSHALTIDAGMRPSFVRSVLDFDALLVLGETASRRGRLPTFERQYRNATRRSHANVLLDRVLIEPLRPPKLVEITTMFVRAHVSYRRLVAHRSCALTSEEAFLFFRAMLDQRIVLRFMMDIHQTAWVSLDRRAVTMGFRMAHFSERPAASRRDASRSTIIDIIKPRERARYRYLMMREVGIAFLDP